MQVIGSCASAPMEDPQTLPQALKDAFTATQKLLEYRCATPSPRALVVAFIDPGLSMPPPPFNA